MMNRSQSIRCGIVLAAGEGKRLQPFIHHLRGDALPKQYVNFIGTRSMLEHTFCRAERLIPPEHLFTVASQDHLGHSEVRRQLSSRPSDTVVVQPENKETGPGILLPLVHLCKRYPDAVVAVFPSDHFIVEEDLFMAYVDLAFRVVERDPSYLVLLGIVPNGLEPEYGYILPGGELSNLAPLGVRKVLQFVEKPEARIAQEIVMEGGLWNTMVMVFKGKTLLELLCRVGPALFRSFERIWEAIGTPGEVEVVEEVYRHVKPVDFSRGLMEAIALQYPSSLLVLPVRGVFWSDLGSQPRVAGVLEKIRRLGQLGAIAETQL